MPSHSALALQKHNYCKSPVCMNFRNNKSKKRWQKGFINKVFSRKSKYQNSFSKIILNNPELLNDKNSHIPRSLFKFYAPTSSNIIDIKKQRLWLSHPGTFNDPFDCHTGYDVVSYEKQALVEHIRKIGCVDSENSKDGFTDDDFNRILSSITEYQYDWRSDIEEFSTVLWKLSKVKSKEFNNKIYEVTKKCRNEVKEKIDKLRNVNIRVACFSALDRNHGFDSIIQMWSHYADNHKGFCVEYDISPLTRNCSLTLQDYDFYKEQQSVYLDERIRVVTLAGLFPVIYTASRVNIPTTKLKKIKLDNDNGLQHNSDIDALLYKTYIVKSAKWNYEKEWRIILDGNICSFYENKIPFPYIKRIFLGCKMHTQNIDIMVEIAEELNVEVIIMSMENKKFILEEQDIRTHKWDKKRSKWHNPFA